MSQKTFDCVELKNKIQAQIYKSHQGMSNEDVQQAIEQKLAQSNSPVARLWRKLQRRNHPPANKNDSQVQQAIN